MTRRSIHWRLAAAAGATALVLAGCGSSDDGDDETTEDSAAASGDGTLVVGTLLPETGSLSFLGPPEFAGVQLAVEDINAADGVLGEPVTQIDSDSGDTSSNIAQQSVDTLLSDDADVIVGAASSSVSLSVIDKIVGAGVVQISPANTSTAFTDYEDNGLYFRTAPSDILQGRVLGDLVLNDSHANVVIVALQDAYGETLAEQATVAIEDGGGTVAQTIFFDPKAGNYAAEITEAKGTNADAVLLIAFDETKTIIPEAVKQNFGPQDVPYYFVDGNLADYSEDFDAGTLAGTKGTLPGNETQAEFQERLQESYGELQDFSYAGEAYDATVLAALAAEAAGDDSGESIASQLQAVSADGTKCTSFAECRDLIADGEDIDYDGVSGPVDWDENGDPTAAYIGIYQYGDDNTYEAVDFQFGEL